MTGSPILSTYFAYRFAKTIIAIFLLCLMLIAIIDSVEVIRRHVDDAGRVALISILRVPSISETVLPFATLFGAIASFAIANRNQEFVVARAAGVSAWQFLLPGAAVALLIGIFATTVYNPISAQMLERSTAIESASFGNQAAAVTTATPVWFRQNGRDGESIMTAADSLNEGIKLVAVTAFRFARDGSFLERIDAPTATLVGQEWVFDSAVVTASGADPKRINNYKLHTFLTAQSVKKTLANPNAVSFWALPGLIQVTEQQATPANRLRMQYHTLLSRPLLLLAMVLIAAVVSLRFTRAGNIGRMILSGVVAGFVLYVISEIAKDLGESGIVPPAIAAWFPSVVAIVLGLTVLLFQEDG